MSRQFCPKTDRNSLVKISKQMVDQIRYQNSKALCNMLCCISKSCATILFVKSVFFLSCFVCKYMSIASAFLRYASFIFIKF